jgi:hypothetical protein
METNGTASDREPVGATEGAGDAQAAGAAEAAAEVRSRRRWSGIAGLLGAGLVAGAVLAGTLSAGAASSNRSAATGSQTAASGTASTGSSSGAARPGDPAAVGHGPGETLLTAAKAAKVTAAAKAAVPGATVVRVETDSDGAAYEAHMQKADGSFMTVKLDKSLTVTDTVSGFGGGPGHAAGTGA